ncbi:uncharacterized protein LOC124149925 [Haliotis rufescens]|uniref:uncharacterized protein LOC124149925 n=1 Tax=Haliotis rufescens TaxID=6454 RepID=UPI001EB01E00|nr:uncharacterized protein LOC124149925 [Haliotis rufescens]
MASSVSNKYSYSDTFEGTSVPSETSSPEIVYTIPFDEDKNISRTSQYSSGSLSDDSTHTQTLTNRKKCNTSKTSQYSSTSSGHQTSHSHTPTFTSRENQTTNEHSSGGVSYDRTSYTHAYTSDVSDTLTYQEDFTDVEGGTDVEDAFSYSDTFEDSAFPTDTVRSSVQEGQDSRSYLETVASEDTSNQERKYLDDSFESPSLTATSRDGHTLDFTESHIFGPATEEIRELSAEDLAKAEAFEARENFLNNLLGRLKASKTVSNRSTRPQQVKKASKSRDEKKFCQRTINRLRSPKMGEADIRDAGAHQSETLSSQPLEAYGLAPALMDRLKLDNLIHKMKKLSSQEVHDVHKCKPCRKQQRKLEEAEARQHFLNYHHHRLQARDVDARVDSHLTRMTSINLIGELVQMFPRPDTSSGDLLYLYKQQLHRRRMDA